MRHTLRPRRLAAALLLLCTAAGLAGCDNAGTPQAGGTPSMASTPGSPVSPTGPAMAGACGYLTAADVTSALSEQVTNTTAGSPQSASDGSQIDQCLLSTDGPALLGGAAQSVLAFVAALAGSQPNVDLKTGGIAVLVTRTATPITADATGAPVPSGGTEAKGIGKSAYSIPSPTGGGIAVSQVDDKTTVIIVDLEAKKVTADQLTALLKAAVARV